MKAEYGYELEDLFKMKWRRFRTLVSRGFAPSSAGSGPSRSDGGFDWSVMDQIIGRETPTNVTRMDLNTFMSRFN